MENKKDKSDLTEGHEQELFSNLEFSYSRSKADVWSSMEGLLGDEPEVQKEEVQEQAKPETAPKEDGAEIIEFDVVKPVKRGRTISISHIFMSIAASLALILCAGLMARYYTTTVEVAPGEFSSHTLPDGSEVHLNAATTLSYHPYWWRMNRAVALEGEAYFVVAKGKKFTVDTKLGSTEVLGTEFNVYARDDDFKVFCEEGRVKVASEKVVEGTSNEVILTAGELAVFELNQLEKEEGSLAKLTGEDAVARIEVLSWRTGQFIYNTTPFIKVKQDFERQYNVTINLADETLSNWNYSGFFDRDRSIEQSLEIVLGSEGLTYENTGERTYLIKKE